MPSAPTSSDGPPPPELSVARGTAYGLVADAAAVVSGLVVSIVVARYLGPTNRGVYALALLVATLVAIAGDFGLSTSGVVFAANRRIPLARLHGMALALSVAVAALAGAILLLTADWLTDTVLKGVERRELWLVTLGIVPTLYAQVAMAMLVGLGRLRVLAILRTAAAIAAPCLMLPAVWISGGSPFWAVAGWLATVTALAAPVAVVATRAMGAPVPPSAPQARTLLGFGLRAYVGTLSHHGYLKTDVLFISSRSGPTDVGYYSLASVMAEQISTVGSALYGASASRIGSGDRRLAEDLTASLVRILVLALVPAAAALAAVSWILIPLAFGSDFRPTVLPFVLLLPGTVCLTIWYVMGLFIVAALHRPGITTVIQGAALLVSLPLYWIAVGEAGMTGAAIVSSATYSSVMAAGILVFVRQRRSAAARLVPGMADVRQARRLAGSALAQIPWRARHA